MLADFDGRVPGRPILIGYRGRVYDVSASFMWMQGSHFWLRAGEDLSGRMGEGPHGEEMLVNVPCVGELVGAAPAPGEE
jgi:predicted heme/steroid binding protein